MDQRLFTAHEKSGLIRLTSGGNSGKRLEEHAVREVLEKASWVMQEKLDYLKYSADLGGFPIAEDENLFTITT